VKLHIENDFPCDANLVWDTFQDPEFLEKLEATSGVRYEVLSEETVDGLEERRIKCIAKKELPRVLKRALGADRLTYDQVTHLDRSRNHLTWQVVPMALADKVTAEGTTVVEEREGESHRTVAGEIVVRLPLIGGQIEKLILREVQASYERAAELALDLIEKKLSG
jgi:hypothetical protein